MNRILFQVVSCSSMVAAALLFTVSHSVAQGYPQKPVRMVLPMSPGGGADTLARIIVPEVAEVLGEPIVLDNRPGASGIIASEIVARSAPDGYTLLMGSSIVMTFAKSLYKLSFDPIKDFAPIIQLGTSQFILVVNPSVPAKTVSELIALAKAKPRSLNYASGGIASPLHLAAELFKGRAGIDMVHVAYKGGFPAAASVVAGETQVLFGSFASSLRFIEAGRLRALAVTGLKRSMVKPELPTMDESGFPGFNVTLWSSFEAPAGTPRNIIARLHDDTIKVLRMPGVSERANKVGYTLTGTSPEQLAEIKRTESAVWAKVIKDANIQAK